MVIDISYVAIQSVVMRRLWCSPPMWRCKHTSPTRIAKATRSKWISGSTTDRLVDDSTATMRAKQRQPPTAMPLTAATAVAAAARQPAPRHCHQRVCTYPPILSLFTCAVCDVESWPSVPASNDELKQRNGALIKLIKKALSEKEVIDLHWSYICMCVHTCDFVNVVASLMHFVANRHNYAKEKWARRPTTRRLSSASRPGLKLHASRAKVSKYSVSWWHCCPTKHCGNGCATSMPAGASCVWCDGADHHHSFTRVCVFCVCSVLAHRIANDFPTLSGDTSVGGAAYGPLRTTAWEAPAARSTSFDADSFPTLGGGSGNTKSGKVSEQQTNIFISILFFVL